MAKLAKICVTRMYIYFLSASLSLTIRMANNTNLVKGINYEPVQYIKFQRKNCAPLWKEAG